MLLIITAVVIILSIVSVLSYAVTKARSDTNAINVFLQCPVGYCATNTTTGVKRCSASNLNPGLSSDRIIYDPASEVCNPVGLCTDTRTPYAELGDGSTSGTGQCQTLTTPCRCLTYPKCPSYASNHFEYSAITDFTQNSEIEHSGNNILIIEGNQGAGSIANSNTAFSCVISGDALSNVITAPGCINYSSNPSTMLDEFITCVQNNPCPDGVMATLMNSEAEVANFAMSGSTWAFPNLGCVKGYDIDNSGVLLKTECNRFLKPSPQWWARHCTPSGFPTDGDWFSYLNNGNSSWSNQCATDIETIWQPIYDKSTHTMYCRNT